MDHLLKRNLWNAKFLIAGVTGAHFFYWTCLTKPRLMSEVFGFDGNGGKMIKIITDLTDEEMARLKYVRRLAWHWRGSRSLNYGRDAIHDEEMADRGLEV